MNDWKSALQGAAKELALGTNKATKGIDTALLGKTASPQKRVQSAVDKHPKPKPKSANIPTVARPDVSKVGPRSTTPMLSPRLSPPISKLQPPKTKLVDKIASPSRTVRISSVAKSQVPGPRATELSFPEPDMRLYPIQFPECASRLKEDWQCRGTSLILGQAQAGRRRFCVLGLDFGTAFTKACIGVGNDSYIVHWDSCVDYSKPYLLPSVFSELSDGTCVLGTAPVSRQYSNLKMALLGNPTPEDKVRAVIFIALATRYVRSWLYKAYGSIVENFHLDWRLNVGLPASSWEDTPVSSLYRQIAFAGWRLGASAGKITVTRGKTALDAVEEIGGSGAPDATALEMVETFPEFGAQIHSYRSSAQSKKDLHLLVDIGAGTVDVVTFHVGEDEESELNGILESDVKKSGTHVLLGYRAQQARLKNRLWDDSDTQCGMTIFESRFGLKPGSLKPVQDDFVGRLSGSIRKVLSTTRQKRYETSPNWIKGIPFFLSGGGRDVDAYREATSSTRRLLEPILLQVPPNVISGKLTADDFHRLSVAHGLSHSGENLAKTIRKSEMEDIRHTPGLKINYRDNYIEK